MAEATTLDTTRSPVADASLEEGWSSPGWSASSTRPAPPAAAIAEAHGAGPAGRHDHRRPPAPRPHRRRAGHRRPRPSRRHHHGHDRRRVNDAPALKSADIGIDARRLVGWLPEQLREPASALLVAGRAIPPGGAAPRRGRRRARLARPHMMRSRLHYDRPPLGARDQAGMQDHQATTTCTPTMWESIYTTRLRRVSPVARSIWKWRLVYSCRRTPHELWRFRRAGAARVCSRARRILLAQRPRTASKLRKWRRGRVAQLARARRLQRQTEGKFPQAVTSRNSHLCRSGSSIACPASSSEWHRVAPAGRNSG
jgi:hypothetical protein